MMGRAGRRPARPLIGSLAGMGRPLIVCAAVCLTGAPAAAQFCAEQSIRWSEPNGAVHTTVVEGRVRDGCPMIRHTIDAPGAPRAEAVGRDCDCDLIVDGQEARFTAPLPIVAGRLLSVCTQNRATAQRRAGQTREPEAAGTSAPPRR